MLTDRREMGLAVQLADVMAGLTTAAFVAAVFSRPPGAHDTWASFLTSFGLAGAVIFAGAWHICHRRLGLYRRNTGMTARLACRCVTACGLPVTGFSLWAIGNSRSQHLALTIIAFGAAALTVEFARAILLARVEERWQSRKESVVILGTGRRAQMAWHELRVSNHRSVDFLGFVDDCDLDAVAPDIRDNFLCSVANLPEYLLAVPVDTIVVAKSLRANFALTRDAVGIAEAFGVKMLCLENIFELGRRHMASERSCAFTGGIESEDIRSFALGIKYRLDRVIAFLLLIAFAPLFLVISLTIKCIAGDPVLVRRRRYGVRRRPFSMLTFNTTLGQRWALDQERSGDSWADCFGWFLRETYLDRLPRLWNVLRGEMSLVGPEAMETTGPSPLEEPAWAEMFRIRPGLCRPSKLMEASARTPEKIVATDITYLQHWSLWADVHLLVRILLTRAFQSNPRIDGWSHAVSAIKSDTGDYNVATGELSE